MTGGERLGATIRYISFDAWWQRFVRLASGAHLRVLGDRYAYREYFEDGDTPEAAVSEEIKRQARRRTASPQGVRI